MTNRTFRWEFIKAENISAITNKDDLPVIYGTNLLTSELPFKEVLTPEELSYSERLKGLGQKETWVCCRTSLRLVMGSYLNRKPIDIEFKKGRFGKLHIENCRISFNLSHSGNSFLLGFNSNGRIGIDIEKLSGKEDLPRLIDYAFSENEAKYCSNGEIAERFMETWTLKEAFLKAVGVGLVDNLELITVNGTPDNNIVQLKLNQETFPCPNGETGSIVYKNNLPLKFIHLI